MIHSDAFSPKLKKRLLSYRNWSGQGSTALSWALAGFTYNQLQLTVCCEECGLEVKDIKQYLVPSALHRAFDDNSRCPFLRSLAVTYDTASRGRGCGATEVITMVTEYQPGNLSESQGQTSVAKRYQLFTHIIERKCIRQVACLTVQPTTHLGWTCERQRKKSFERFASQFSTTERKSLSEQGLYLQARDETSMIVRCTFCQFSTPLTSDDSLSTLTQSHRKSLPVCNHLAGLSSHNIPDVLTDSDDEISTEIPGLPSVSNSQLQTFGINGELPKEPEFAIFEKRKSTYLTFSYNGFNLDVESLCDAGFYFVGNEVLVCFFCKVETDNWQAAEDPWKRHARASPSCQFLIAKKGQGYVADILSRFGEYSRGPEENRIYHVDTRMLRPRLHSRAAQKALAMGVDSESLRTVLIRGIKRGDEDFRYVADLVRTIQELAAPEVHGGHRDVPDLLSIAAFPENHEDIQVEERNTPLVASADGSTNTACSTVAMTTQNNQQHSEEPTDDLSQPGGGEPAEVSGEDNSEDAASTFRSIRSNLTCSVCLESIVEVVFLPCGHLVCCLTCSTAMVHCPLCRVQIRATVRAHF